MNKPTASSDTGAILQHTQQGFLRSLWRGLSGYSPVVIILCVLLVVLIVPPLVFLVRASFYTTNMDGSFSDPTLQYYAALFTNPRFSRNLINTLVYSVGSAAVAIVLGVVQAWIVERTNTPLRQYVFLFSIVSLGIPGVLYTVSWLLILGNAGPVNQLLRFILGTEDTVFNVYSMTGMIVIEGLSWAPMAFLLVSAIFRYADASFEEASLMSGANLRKTFIHITLKLATPAILALVMLVVIRAFESFEVPALVGRAGNVFVLTTDIYDSIRERMPPNYGQAGAFSVVLLLIVVVMLQFYSRLSRNAKRYQTITGKGFRPQLLDLGRWRILTAAILVGFFFFLIVLPLGMLLWAALLPYFQHFSSESIGLLTFKNFIAVGNSASARSSVVNTLLLGAGTATVVTALTTVCAWLTVRQYKGAWLLDQLATMPLVFPAIVMGIAFLQTFLRVPLPLYGTLLSIIIASTVLFLPYGMRYAYAGIMQIHTELEEASLLSGARPGATFRYITLPLIVPTLVTCWLFVFLLGARAVALPILLAGPNTQVVAVTLFDLWENGQVTELAAMGISWTALMTVISAAFYLIAKRFGLSVK